MRISWLAIAAIGCSSSAPAESPPAPVPPAPKVAESPVPAPAKDEPEAKASPAKPPPANAPSKDKLAEFRKRMNAGWKLQKEERWAESVPEFEAALAAVPADQRALTELGWSAMKAGDFDKARRADEEAILVAIDKRVKAQGLYNLGQVQEKTGDKDGAQKSYLASLALRPNKTVEDAVARLGAVSSGPRAEQPFCAAAPKACECIVAHAFGPSAQGTACEELKDQAGGRLAMIFPPVSGFRVYRATSEHARWDYVLDEKSQLVSVVGGSYDHAGRTETVQLTKTELRSIAGKAVMRIETTTKASATRPIADADAKDAVEIEDVETMAATLCVIGVGGTPTRCPLRDVPLLHSVVVERGKQTTRTETHAELTISEEGVATVKQLKGPSDTSLSALVGPHRLWK